ncbi:Chemotaxis protein CheY [Candidatus Bealeia paramacronuclearis]|uniref:Chemotaxis protein CheY n=1 Tax=Candidatus Bealeia paramacronuclearis TaxID=1921001 RepID=A0ABZ2C6X6_9PROT|nr:Chemotaxis protein CheY [Candidatus Bealeia paramacronuclearis]
MSVDKNMPILIVDDFKMMRRVVRNLLTQLGFANLDEAADGGEALQKIKAKSYRLVVSDWNMEPMSGIELLEKVKSSPDTKNIDFIMLTAEGKTDNIIKAKQLGVNSYIVKPFTAKVLKEKLVALIGPF